MLKLTNEDRQQLREAILSAYPDPNDLEIFIDEALGQNLAAITGRGKYRYIVFQLIGEATAKGFINKLILALAKDTQNPDIRQFCARILPQYLSLNHTGAIASSVPSWPLSDLQDEWDIDITDEMLQSFLPKQFSYEADVGDLLRGLMVRSPAVCKITFTNRPGVSGTGVLIAANLVLTNYHVLSLQADADLNAIARSARFQFGHISTQISQYPGAQILTTVEREAEKSAVVCFSAIEDLDYALLRLKADETAAIQPVAFDGSASLRPQSPLSILQHPEGDHLKVSLSNNGIVKAKENRGLVLYVNRTKGGSSGSPCFDEEWRLVALHHKELATSFGSVREGILFSAIYPQIAPFL
ncbi:MAG: trypsin-like peptidase domain-containing protein [Phormidesmis sp.]